MLARLYAFNATSWCLGEFIRQQCSADARAKSVSSFRLMIACLRLLYAVQQWSWVDEHPFHQVSKPKKLRDTESHTRGVVERMNQAIFGK